LKSRRRFSFPFPFAHLFSSLSFFQPQPSLSLSGQNIRKLVKDGFILKKPCKIHSRSRARAAAEAKAKGRHTGYGKRRG